MAEEELKGIEYWKPANKGDKLEGVVKEVKEGDLGLFLVMEKKDGTLTTTPAHTVLKNKLISAKVGDNLRITYDGQSDEPPKKGHSPLELYNVVRIS